MTKRGHPVVVLVNREEWEARQQLVRAEAREELRHRLKQLRERVTCAVVDVATGDQSSVGGRTHERQQDQSTRWVEVGVSRARRRAGPQRPRASSTSAVAALPALFRSVPDTGRALYSAFSYMSSRPPNCWLAFLST